MIENKYGPVGPENIIYSKRSENNPPGVYFHKLRIVEINAYYEEIIGCGGTPNYQAIIYHNRAAGIQETAIALISQSPKNKVLIEKLERAELVHAQANTALPPQLQAKSGMESSLSY